MVTAAGSGIGRATAIRLIREGARVIATDVMPERLAVLEREPGGGQLVTAAWDIVAEDTVRSVVAETEGRVDALANAAGILNGFLPSAEIDDTPWEKVMGVNVTTVMCLTRSVLP